LQELTLNEQLLQLVNTKEEFDYLVSQLKILCPLRFSSEEGNIYSIFIVLKGGANKMDEAIHKKLDEYLGLIEEISARTDSDIIAVGILHELCKDRRSDQFRNHRIIDGDSAATEKQIAYLKNLDQDIPEYLTKQQAAVMIDKAKNTKSIIEQISKMKEFII
jgi:hypothetical protein